MARDEAQEQPPEVPSNNIGNWIADVLPFMPSTSVNAGRTQMLAKRMDSYASPLITHPVLTQMAALLGSGITLHNTKNWKMALLPWLLASGARRAEINHISNKYQDHPKRKLESLRHMQRHVGSPLTFTGSQRLGRTMAYLGMAGKDAEQPLLSQMGDPAALTIPGYGALVAPLVDNLSAGHLIEKHAYTEEEERRRRRKMVPLADPRSNSLLPAYLAALAGGVGSGYYASKNMEPWANRLQPTKSDIPLFRSTRQDIIQRVAGRKIPVFDVANMENAFYSPQGAPRGGGSFIGLGERGFSSPTILAHEAGHGRVDGNKGTLASWLQNNAYGYKGLTTTLAPVAGLGMGALAGGPLKGLLAGALTGGALNSGYLVPEYMASHYARKGLRNSSGGYDHDLQPKALNAALATYLAAGVAPSAIAGMLGGWIRGSHKKKPEEAKEAAVNHFLACS